MIASRLGFTGRFRLADKFAAAGRGLPLGPVAGARLLPWIFALMAYVAGLGSVGLAAIGDTMRGAEHSLAARLTLTVPAEASAARLQTILALLRQTPGIAAVHQLTPAETAALLEPWLGPSAPLAELPVPRLIDLRADPAARLDLSALRQHLASLVGRRRAAQRIAGVLAVVVAGALLLVVPAAVFATRMTLLAQQPAIELVHLLGAADRAITERFALRVLVAGLLGGALGGGGVLATILVLGNPSGIVGLPVPIVAAGLTDWRVWTIVLAVALATAAIATASAAAILLRRLALMP
jgi:cell division transport system permease protein